MNYLTEQQSTDLITKLSGDDEFRAAFAADPASVLAEHYDVTLRSEDIPSGSIELPSKQQFTDEFDGYVANANESVGCQKVHNFVYAPEES
jgi:putative modified peptide